MSCLSFIALSCLWRFSQIGPTFETVFFDGCSSTSSLEYGSESHSGTIDNVNIASGLITAHWSIDVALEVSRTYKFSAKFVLMLGTVQSEGLSDNDGEYMMTVVRGSSIHPSIVPVDSTVSDSESLPPNSLCRFCINHNRPTYIMVSNNLFKNEAFGITSARTQAPHINPP